MLHVHMYCIPLEGPFFEKRRIKLLRANDLDFMIIRAYIFWVANGEFTIILFLLKITFSSIARYAVLVGEGGQAGSTRVEMQDNLQNKL